MLRALYHLFFWPRVRHDRAMKTFASKIPSGARVLEVGSGKPVGGRYPYSAARYFEHCDFLLSDVEPRFGHRVLDISDPPLDESFDVVIASSVLEHVYEYEAAIAGIRSLLREGGLARIRVPFLFPLHDEPNDYWRFTQHALLRMFDDFRIVKIKHEGFRRAPLGYVALVTK